MPNVVPCISLALAMSNWALEIMLFKAVSESFSSKERISDAMDRESCSKRCKEPISFRAGDRAITLAVDVLSPPRDSRRGGGIGGRGDFGDMI